MALAGKHQFGAIDDKRVTFVEKGIDENRMQFLKTLLEHNGFEVLIAEKKKKNEEDPTMYDLGVTDMIFNPTIWIFERKLKTPDGRIVNQKYWEQKTEDDLKPQYWENN
jgi:hypothetical protein